MLGPSAIALIRRSTAASDSTGSTGIAAQKAGNLAQRRERRAVIGRGSSLTEKCLQPVFNRDRRQCRALGRRDAERARILDSIEYVKRSPELLRRPKVLGRRDRFHRSARARQNVDRRKAPRLRELLRERDVPVQERSCGLAHGIAIVSVVDYRGDQGDRAALDGSSDFDEPCEFGKNARGITA